MLKTCPAFMLFDSRGNYAVCITVRKPIMSKAKLLFWASLVAQMVKRLSAMQETPVRSQRSAGEGIAYPLQYSGASLVALRVKNLPAIWETRV